MPPYLLMSEQVTELVVTEAVSQGTARALTGAVWDSIRATDVVVAAELLLFVMMAEVHDESVPVTPRTSSVAATAPASHTRAPRRRRGGESWGGCTVVS